MVGRCGIQASFQHPGFKLVGGDIPKAAPPLLPLLHIILVGVNACHDPQRVGGRIGDDRILLWVLDQTDEIFCNIQINQRTHRDNSFGPNGDIVFNVVGKLLQWNKYFGMPVVMHQRIRRNLGHCRIWTKHSSQIGNINGVWIR